MIFRKARWFHEGRIRPIRLVVIHDMEWPENVTAAEDCAAMFATMERKASAHICVDSDSEVRSVKDSDTAWAAPGANADGLQLEIAGRARQKRAEWLDAYSTAALRRAARIVAAWCITYDIPARRLSQADLKAGRRGIIGHIDASRAYGGDHTDPGAYFPWDTFLSWVTDEMRGTASPVPLETLTPTEKIMRELPILREGAGDDPTDILRWDVKTVAKLLEARGYALPTGIDITVYRLIRSVVETFQAEWKPPKGVAKLDVDGVTGPRTWSALTRTAG